MTSVLGTPNKSSRPVPLKPAEFIATHQIFRFDEFREAHAASGASEKTTDAVLRYHVSKGRLQKLRRGLYSGPDVTDPWLLGSRLSSDAVIAYDGALSFHELGDSRHQISFLTEERTIRFVFGDMIYQPVRVPAALINRPNWGGHILRFERQGQSLKVTSPERTLVDLLDRLDLADGSRALWDAFRAAKKADWEVMIQYAKRLDNRGLIGRLAVFLQLLGAKNHVLDGLDRFAPRSPCYFDKRERRKGDPIFSRWNVIVPQKLLKHINSGATEIDD